MCKILYEYFMIRQRRKTSKVCDPLRTAMLRKIFHAQKLFDDFNC